MILPYAFLFKLSNVGERSYCFISTAVGDGGGNNNNNNNYDDDNNNNKQR